MGDYTINFTDTAKNSFRVNVNTTNGPCFPTFNCSPSNSNGQNTSLLLYGYGVSNYGERIQENLVHMLENFAGSAYPYKPIQGQLWYAVNNYWYDTTGVGTWFKWSGTTWVSITTPPNISSSPPQNDGQLFLRTGPRLFQYKTVPDTGGTVLEQELVFNIDNQTPFVAPNNNKPPIQILKVYDGTTWTNVADITITTVSSVEPLDPTDGDLWYDTNVGQQKLKIFDGSLWVDTINTSDFVNNSGDTMTGILDMNGQKITNLPAPTANNDAVRKSYVDSQITGLSSSYLRLDGTNSLTSTMNAGGFRITNIGTPTQPSDAATRQYVIDSVNQLSSTLPSTYVNILGDVMQGSISFATTIGNDGYRITNLANPRTGFPYDATNKLYVDNSIQTATDVLNARIDAIEGIVGGGFEDNYIAAASFNQTTNTLTLEYNTGSLLVDLEVTGIASVDDINNITFDADQFVVDQDTFLTLEGTSLQQILNDIDHRLALPFSRNFYRVQTRNITVVDTIYNQLTVAGDHVDEMYSGRQLFIEQCSRFPITAIDTGTKKFTIAGDYTSMFRDGATITISQSTDNNGYYTVNGNSTFVSGNTEIIVNETIQSSVVEGKLHLGPFAINTSEYTGGNTVITLASEQIPHESYIITGIDAISPHGIIKISGDRSIEFKTGDPVDIFDSPAVPTNDGSYIVFADSTYDSLLDETTIELTTTLPSLTPGGSIRFHYSFVNIGDDLIPATFICEQYYVGTYSTSVYINGLKQIVSDFSVIHIRLNPEQTNEVIVRDTETGISTGQVNTDVTSGYQSVELSQQATGSMLTGYSPGIYTCTITVAGVPTSISIDGSVATLDLLKSQIETQTSNNVVVKFKDNYIVVYDNIGTGALSTVTIVDGVSGVFNSLANYVQLCTGVAGRTDPGGAQPSMPWNTTINGENIIIDQRDVFTYNDLINRINIIPTGTRTYLLPNRLSIIASPQGNVPITITDGLTGSCTDGQRVFFSLTHYSHTDDIRLGFIADYNEGSFYGGQQNTIQLIDPPHSGDKIEIFVCNLLGA